MAAYVLDTSAVVKRYIQEAGTGWVRSIADPAASHLIYLARITDVEVTSAVVRRQRGGNLSASDAAATLTQFRQDLIQGYRIIEITPALLLVARSLAEQHGLRAYDAVQLASAVELNAQWVAAGTGTITVVSADQELSAAAKAEGLFVEDPNLHPRFTPHHPGMPGTGDRLAHAPTTSENAVNRHQGSPGGKCWHTFAFGTGVSRWQGHSLAPDTPRSSGEGAWPKAQRLPPFTAYQGPGVIPLVPYSRSPPSTPGPRLPGMSDRLETSAIEGYNQCLLSRMERTSEPGGSEAMRISLTVRAGPHEGQVFEFQERAFFVVGRSERANFRLPVKDNSISRLHFMIEMNPPRCRLTDMDSTNGTRVNGRKVAMADLKNGDLITAGKTSLLVSVIGSDEPLVSPTETVLTSGAAASDAPRQTGPHAVPTAAPSRRPLSTAHYSSRPRPAEKTPHSCRLCGDSLAETGTGAGSSGSQYTNAEATSLCPTCLGRVGSHPQPIPGYQVVRELGRGGMGVVYQAIRAADGGLVALKTIQPAIDPTPLDMDRFLREAHILSELDHPNIVSFHELGESNGLLYFAMDYVAGTDAARLLKQNRGPLPIARAVDLVCQVLRALDYAHAKGFVHLDVKPSNMLVAQEAGRDVVRLSDFGLARIYLTSKMSGLSTDDGGGGTAPFMAPEQINDLRATKPSADQYSAAATLYNFLTDRFIYDFPKKLHAKIMKILLEDPVPIRDRRPDLPEGLAAIIHRALARDPQARYPNVREMRRALLPFAK